MYIYYARFGPNFWLFYFLTLKNTDEMNIRYDYLLEINQNKP